MKNNTEFPSVRPGTCANKTGKGVEPREMEKNRRASRLIDSSTKKNIFFRKFDCLMDFSVSQRLKG